MQLDKAKRHLKAEEIKFVLVRFLYSFTYTPKVLCSCLFCKFYIMHGRLELGSDIYSNIQFIHCWKKVKLKYYLRTLCKESAVEQKRWRRTCYSQNSVW
jgi:hypothetical protein